jgi:hypothetical protein
MLAMVVLVVATMPLAEARSVDEPMGAAAAGFAAAAAIVIAQVKADACRAMAGDASLSMSSFQLASAGCPFTPIPPTAAPASPSPLNLAQKTIALARAPLDALASAPAFSAVSATTFPAQAVVNAVTAANPARATVMDPVTPAQVASQPNTPAGVAASAVASARAFSAIVFNVEAQTPTLVKMGDKIPVLITTNTVIQSGTATFTCARDHQTQTAGLEGGPSLVVHADYVANCRGVVLYDIVVPNGRGSGNLGEATGSFTIPETRPSVRVTVADGASPFPSDRPLAVLLEVSTPDAPDNPASEIASITYTPNAGQAVSVPVHGSVTQLTLAEANTLVAGSYGVKFQAVTKTGLVGKTVSWSFEVAARTSLGFTNRFETTNIPSASNAVLLADVDCGAEGNLVGTIWWDVTQATGTGFAGVHCAKGHNTGLVLGRHAYLAGDYYACVNLELQDGAKALLAGSQGTCGALAASAHVVVKQASGAPPAGAPEGATAPGTGGAGSHDTSTTGGAPPAGSNAGGADTTPGANTLLNKTQAGATNALDAAQGSASSIWYSLTHGATLWLLLAILLLGGGAVALWHARQHGLLERWGIYPTVEPANGGKPGGLLRRLRHPFGGGKSLPTSMAPSLTFNIRPPPPENEPSPDLEDAFDDTFNPDLDSGTATGRFRGRTAAEKKNRKPKTKPRKGRGRR